MITDAGAGRLMRKRRLRPIEREFDEQTLKERYAEVAEEDRALAESGLAEYARLLAEADKEE